MRLPSGTITFLFTDIEGSTRLWDQYPEAMRNALARHDVLLKAAIEANHGYVFKTVGDAFCAAFRTAPEALSAALAAQTALRLWTDEEVGALRVRMALHAGAAEERDNDYFGPTLNRVARLLSIGYGGQVLLSEAAQALTAGSLPDGCALRDLGSHRLKDLHQPEHVFQLIAPGLPADFPALKSLDALPTNLPIQLTSFIAREKEMDEIQALLAQTRLLTLTGSGGCGKTRLALQVAADLLDSYPDGVWFVALDSLSDPDLVPQVVASALAISEEPGRPLMQTLAVALQPRRMLLVLDNAEHLAAACARLADTLLKSSPQLRLLVTSREALRVTGEQVYRVPSLPAPDPAKLPGKEIERALLVSEYAACRLFVERASLQKPDFALTNQNAPVVASICHHLDGIPLAIELAAARVRALSVADINARLQNRFRLLTGGSHATIARQQTLQAAIDWSYDLLNEPERVLLARLSVFAGGWTLEAAEQICGDLGLGTGDWAKASSAEGDASRSGISLVPNPQFPVPVFEILDLLTSLVDKSLVVFEEREGRSRYRLLETIRQYGRERLEQAGMRELFQRRHLDYYLALAEQADPYLRAAGQTEWLERLEDEHDNLRMALACSQSLDQTAEQGLRLAGALYLFWQLRGYYSEGRAYLNDALAREGAHLSPAARAKALNAAGVLAWRQGDDAAAQALHEESLTIKRALGDKQGIANSLNNLGILATNRADYAAARALLEESLALKREIGNRQSLPNTLNNLADVTFKQGDYVGARALFEECLALYKEHGNRQGIAYMLQNLAETAYSLGDPTTTRALCEESLAIQRELGDRQGIASALHILARLAGNQGDIATARAQCEESLAIRRELGNSVDVADVLMSLGSLHGRLGDTAAACALYAECMAILSEVRDTRSIICALEGIAEVAYTRQQPVQAVCLWAAADAMRQALGYAIPPSERDKQEEQIAAARAVLTEAMSAAAWEEGRSLSLDQAIAYALEVVACPG